MNMDALRKHLAVLLADGLATKWQQRAYTSEEVIAAVARLQPLARDDYAGKLSLAGFTLTPYAPDDTNIKQACSTCIYYVPHRRFCSLPELRLPVEAEWSCILWRV